MGIKETVDSENKYTPSSVIPDAGAGRVRSPYFKGDHWRYKDDDIERPIGSYTGVSPYPYPIASRQVGDEWKEIDIATGLLDEIWYWNGSIWVSGYKESIVAPQEVTVDRYFSIPVKLSELIYVDTFKINHNLTIAGTAANYWRFVFYRVSPTGAVVPLGEVNTSTFPLNGVQSIVLQQFETIATTQTTHYLVWCDRISAAPALRVGVTMTYRRAKNG